MTFKKGHRPLLIRLLKLRLITYRLSIDLTYWRVRIQNTLYRDLLTNECTYFVHQLHEYSFCMAPLVGKLYYILPKYKILKMLLRDRLFRCLCSFIVIYQETAQNNSIIVVLQIDYNHHAITS